MKVNEMKIGRKRINKNRKKNNLCFEHPQLSHNDSVGL